jgi:putative membrane protein
LGHRDASLGAGDLRDRFPQTELDRNPAAAGRSTVIDATARFPFKLLELPSSAATPAMPLSSLARASEGLIRSPRVNILINSLIVYVIVFHVWAMVLEMFLWTKPLGRKTFGLSKEDAETSKTLAANQGLYNGFLAAGLVLSFLVANPDTAFTLKLFFLACVALAGLYGGITAKMSILFMQGLPAMIALALLLFARA